MFTYTYIWDRNPQYQESFTVVLLLHFIIIDTETMVNPETEKHGFFCGIMKGAVNNKLAGAEYFTGSECNHDTNFD